MEPFLDTVRWSQERELIKNKTFSKGSKLTGFKGSLETELESDIPGGGMKFGKAGGRIGPPIRNGSWSSGLWKK
jgi:hypothetical protein